MTYPCQCVLIIPGNPLHPRETLNLCGGFVTGPDQPMCDQCFNDRHDRNPDQMPMTDPRRVPLFGGLSRARG